MPIEHIGGWLFRVARNRITDLFRKKKEEAVDFEIDDLLPSPDGDPADALMRGVLLDELELAINELPEEQRLVFVAHEIEGQSFKDMAAETGIGINTLLSRKRYAVLHLRERLQRVHDEFIET